MQAILPLSVEAVLKLGFEKKKYKGWPFLTYIKDGVELYQEANFLEPLDPIPGTLDEYDHASILWLSDLVEFYKYKTGIDPTEDWLKLLDEDELAIWKLYEEIKANSGSEKGQVKQTPILEL